MPRGPRSHLRPVAVSSVATDVSDVDRQLAGALARVDEERYVRAAAQGPDLLDRVHESSMGADLGGRHQADRSGRERRRQRGDVERSVSRTGYDLDRPAGQLADLQETQVVAVVGHPVDEKSVAARDRASEREAPHRLHPRLGVGSGQRDLVPFRAYQARDADHHRLQPVRGCGRGFVAPPFGLESEMPEDRVERRLRGESRSGVVQVCDPATPRRLRPLGLDVDGGRHACAR